MDYVPLQESEKIGKIICCECGVLIDPNPANMCVGCIRTKVDVTEGIPKQGIMSFCRNCERYLQPPSNWVSAALESQVLLGVCLKKIKGLSKLHLVDAGFVWTEPHSKRIKVKLTVQKEVLGSTILQQTFIVEFVVTNQMCDDCHRVEAKDFWKAVVQIRQKTEHKKTFFYLEQLILKHGMQANTLNVKQNHDGLDFYYAQKNDARKIVDYLMSVVPCRYKTSQTLISHDVHTNVFNYKYTFSIEIVPVCKDQVVVLPKRLAQTLGNLGQVCVCYKVYQHLYLIDPATCRIAEVSSTKYWQAPFEGISGHKSLMEYMVMTVDHITAPQAKGAGAHVSNKHVLSEVWLEKMSELGMGEKQHHCRTHLGHLLNVGDTVLAFDMEHANVNNPEVEKMSADKVPDVVIVKKQFANRAYRNRKRKWKLKHLDMARDVDTDSVERDYTEFLEELEEDADFRQNVTIYKDPAKISVEPEDSDGEEAPQISLAEMLDDFHISSDATGPDGAPMVE